MRAPAPGTQEHYLVARGRVDPWPAEEPEDGDCPAGAAAEPMPGEPVEPGRRGPKPRKGRKRPLKNPRPKRHITTSDPADDPPLASTVPTSPPAKSVPRSPKTRRRMSLSHQLRGLPPMERTRVLLAELKRQVQDRLAAGDLSGGELRTLRQVLVDIREDEAREQQPAVPEMVMTRERVAFLEDLARTGDWVQAAGGEIPSDLLAALRRYPTPRRGRRRTRR